MPATFNDDNGSLFTGPDRLDIGDKVRIEGEGRTRSVTYVMGSERKGWRACFKGQGAVPIGPVTWERDRDSAAAIHEPIKPTRSPSSPATHTASDQKNSVIGIDFAGPSTAARQRRKILAVKAVGGIRASGNCAQQTSLRELNLR